MIRRIIGWTWLLLSFLAVLMVTEVADAAPVRYHAHRVAAFECASNFISCGGWVFATFEGVPGSCAKCGSCRRLFFDEGGLSVAAAVADALVDGVDLPAKPGLAGHGPARLSQGAISASLCDLRVIAGDEEAPLEFARCSGCL